MILRLLPGPLLLLALSGCGSVKSSESVESSAGGACSFVGPAPAAPRGVDPNASPQAQAEAAGRLALDRLVGQFLRGDAAVYRGTVSASTTDALNALSGPDTAMTQLPEGPAVAALTFGATLPGNWFPPAPGAVDLSGQSAVLMVHATSTKQYVDFVETESQPSVLWSGTIGLDRVPNGVSNDYLDRSCTGCGPDLWTHPEAIALSSVQTSGVESVYVGVVNMGGMQVNVPVQMVTTTELTLAAPCSLTWQDLAELNTATGPNTFADFIGLQDFKPTGGDMVWTTGGSYKMPTPGGGCPTYTYYALDLFVSTANLADYGVRNYHVSSSMQSCPP